MADKFNDKADKKEPFSIRMEFRKKSNNTVQNIVFFGTPIFSAKVLSFLLSHQINIVAVVTKPDRPRGRSNKLLPSKVKQYTHENYPHIPLYDPLKASTDAFAEKLSSHHPDLFVVVSYGEIIKQNLLDIPRLGSINVHTSLLPKFRGAAPIQRAIIEGEKETGVTVMEMVLALDAGDIIETAKIPILDEMTFGELEEKLWDLSGPTLLKVLKDFEKGKTKKIPQNDSLATYAKKITPEDCQIDWRKSSQEIHNLIRGVSPRPGAWCFVKINGTEKRLKIKLAKLAEIVGKHPGENLIYEKKDWIVSCGTGAIHLLEVQLEGKKALSVEEFIRGFSRPPSIIVK